MNIHSSGRKIYITQYDVLSVVCFIRLIIHYLTIYQPSIITKMLSNLNNKTIVLASGSPRRQQLLKDMGIDFIIELRSIDESFPESLPAHEVAAYLSQQKSFAFKDKELNNKIVITSDTTVCLGDEVLNKPASIEEAKEMLEKLSDNEHQVVTGVTIRTQGKEKTFSTISNVKFKKLDTEEIDYYVNNFKPLDKAGAYGIQEWIGFIGIERLEGSYFNVMGLPTQKLWEALKEF
ncbi:MAG: Maf family nucleotide pyrophosphatase [Hyphomicrobiales bacterium]